MSPARVLCSVTYEFRVIRWANSGGSCARGFRPRARETRKKTVVEREEGMGERRARESGRRVKRAKRQGRGRERSAEERARAKWKKSARARG